MNDASELDALRREQRRGRHQFLLRGDQGDLALGAGVRASTPKMAEAACARASATRRCASQRTRNSAAMASPAPLKLRPRRGVRRRHRSPASPARRSMLSAGVSFVASDVTRTTAGPLAANARRRARPHPPGWRPGGRRGIPVELVRGDQGRTERAIEDGLGPAWTHISSRGRCPMTGSQSRAARLSAESGRRRADRLACLQRAHVARQDGIATRQRASGGDAADAGIDQIGAGACPAKSP